MNNTLLLHMGMPKTGSTALQYFLFINRDNLEMYGWRYPLLVSELPDVQGDQSIVTNGNFFYKLIHEFEYELDTESDAWDKKWNQVLKHLESKNVILSSEAISVHETEKFLAGAVKKYSNIKAVIYLRRQDRAVESFYNNRIKDGVFDGTFKDYLDSDEVKEMCHYMPKLQLISQIIGKENLFVRVYEKRQFSGKKRSIENDFLSILNIDRSEIDWKECGVQNPSLYGNYYDIRQIFNSLYGIDDSLDQEVRKWEYNDLFMKLSNFFHKDKEERGYFNLEDRKEFLNQFLLENKQIAREFLDREDEILFYDDRMDYPLYERNEYNSFEADIIRVFFAMICTQNLRMDHYLQGYQKMKNNYYAIVKKLLMLEIGLKSKERKILLFGAGNKCGEFIDVANNLPIALIVDNDRNKDGAIFKNGIEIIHTSKIKNWSEYFTIVTCIKTDEMEIQLQEIGLNKEEDYILAKEYGL